MGELRHGHCLVYVTLKVQSSEVVPEMTSWSVPLPDEPMSVIVESIVLVVPPEDVAQ